MITRIVKLQFQEDKTNDFLAFFETIKEKVNTFPGCGGMELLQDKSNPTIIFTYSRWEEENALNNYRVSETFGTIWPTIKVWFAAPAEAWTVNTVFDGFSLKKTE